MVSILINEDVFELSYNDLKFTVPKPQLVLHPPHMLLQSLTCSYTLSHNLHTLTLPIMLLYSLSQP